MIRSEKIGDMDGSTSIYHISTDSKVTSFFDGFRVAVAQSSDGNRLIENEERILADNASVIYIPFNNIDGKVKKLSQEEGFFLGPKYICWEKSCLDFCSEIEKRDDLSGKQKRKKKSNWANRLKKTSFLDLVDAPIDSHYFESWYGIFEKQVVGKHKGFRAIEGNFHKVVPKDDWHSIYLLGPEGNVIGGMIIEKILSDKKYKIRAIASEKELYPGADDRLYEEFTRFSISNGCNSLSYGGDSNFYGEMVSTGLQMRKSYLGFKPKKYFEEDRYIKVINSSGLENFYITYAYKDNDPNNELEAHVFGDVPDGYSFPKGFQVVTHNKC